MLITASSYISICHIYLCVAQSLLSFSFAYVYHYITLSYSLDESVNQNCCKFYSGGHMNFGRWNVLSYDGSLCLSAMGWASASRGLDIITPAEEDASPCDSCLLSNDDESLTVGVVNNKQPEIHMRGDGGVTYVALSTLHGDRR